MFVLVLRRELSESQLGNFDSLEMAKEFAAKYLREKYPHHFFSSSDVEWFESSRKEQVATSEPLYLDGSRDDDSHFVVEVHDGC